MNKEFKYVEKGLIGLISFRVIFPDCLAAGGYNKG